MKKTILALILAMAMVIGLVACGGGSNSKKNSSEKSDEKEAQQNTDDVKEPEEKQDSDKSDKRGTMVGSGDLGNYHVEIKGASLTTDYEGNPTVVITYAWTNNSDDTTTSLSSVHAKAFQDGVQLENAIVMNEEAFDSSGYMKEVRPGTTIDIQNAFALTSETSTIEIEIEELISFSDEKVVMDFDPATLS